MCVCDWLQRLDGLRTAGVSKPGSRNCLSAPGLPPRHPRAHARGNDTSGQDLSELQPQNRFFDDEKHHQPVDLLALDQQRDRCSPDSGNIACERRRLNTSCILSDRRISTSKSLPKSKCQGSIQQRFFTFSLLLSAFAHLRLEVLLSLLSFGLPCLQRISNS